MGPTLFGKKPGEKQQQANGNPEKAKTSNFRLSLHTGNPSALH
jgi:hypothetical protein